MANKKQALIFTHEDKQIKNYGRITQNMHYDEIKQIKIEVYNQSDNTVEDIELITNMPKEAYEIIKPVSLPPKKKATIILNVIAKVLFDDDTINFISIAFNYNEVKIIEAE